MSLKSFKYQVIKADTRMAGFLEIQDKWQKKWDEAKVFEVEEDTQKSEISGADKSGSNKEKFYVLEMFPYPSGEGLHLGHALNYTIGDISARFKIMQGFNVLHPMGFDSLGLPAENAAIKAGTHPKEYTENSIKNFVLQQKKLGITYDWSRVVKTSDPSYYKWDQWIFLKMFEKGLAYKKSSPVNWCPECNTVLANEQVHNGKCWRHTDTDVEVKNLEQWFLKITDYAEELNDFSKLEQWPDLIKKLQTNWIGKSYGTEIDFEINGENWRIFTTRPDTLFGVTFMVVSAQHPKLNELVTDDQKKAVEDFVKKLHSVSAEDIEQLEKEGVFTGSYAIHPLTGEKVPVYAGNFVLAEYGSGMVMAVPTHDQRDFEFAKKYNIPLKVVINPDKKELNADEMERAYTADGELVNSGEFDGLGNREAIEKITEHLEKTGKGKKTTNFRLRDWLVSRQRYWGTPIPVVNCSKCGTVAVPEKDLPVELPHDVKFGEGNPLETNEEFVNTKCPKCSGEGKRETDTMDTFVNSSWYNFRYTDPNNDKEIFSKDKVNYWHPIDLYIGGKEHACMHLIYIRFYTKFLRDLGLLKIDEPAIKMFNQGMLHAEDGNKMSKSLGNVINPLDTIKEVGADSLRVYLVSVAAPDSDFNWSTAGLQGCHKFVNKAQYYFENVKIGKSTERTENKINKGVKEITDDIENMRFNLAVIKLRELLDNLGEEESKETLEKYLKLLSPFCPHMTEEMWEKIGNKEFLSKAEWPEIDESKINPELDAAEDLLKNTKEDIRRVMELAKKEKPEKVILIVADEWKYDYITKLKALMEKTRNPGEILKELMSGDLKQYGQQISKLTPKLVNDPSKMPAYLLSQDKEIETLKQLDIENIEIIKAKDSKEAKATQSMPGKPTIIIQ